MSLNMVHETLETMENAVYESARQMKKTIHSSDQLQIQRKADHSLVLNLDLDSEKTISAKLSGILPIVAEETPSSHDLIFKHGDYFLIDPLDGTSACKRYPKSIAGQIGFGPMIGYVVGGKLSAATYINIPTETLFSAVRGQGFAAIKINLDINENLVSFDSREKLTSTECASLSEAAVLFYTSKLGEMRHIEKLRANNVIETAYRYGGFANDASRVARGIEQCIIQYTVKAWDFPAALFLKEAGLNILMGSSEPYVEFDSWHIAHNNPLIAGPEKLLQEMKEKM